MRVLALDEVTWERDGRGAKVAIGCSEFGTVYAGQLHGQPVAIRAEVLRHGEVAPWMAAARLHATSTCPHIVAVRGIIMDRDGATRTHYLVTERLAGTMTDLLLTRSGAHYGADSKLRLQLLADVAGGLAYLHSCAVVHGDVNPDNVLLTAVSPRSPLPTAKLADTGSSLQRRSGTGTRTGDTLVGERGILAYTDPVLLGGSASITAASDVYSFGVLAWQVLSACLPYEAETTALEPERRLKVHVCGPRGKRPPVAALVERGVPPGVVALVESCWASAQGSRPAMAAVQDALDAAVAAGVVTPPPAPAPVRAPAPAPVRAPVPAAGAPPVVTPVWWTDGLMLIGHPDYVTSLAVLQDGRIASGDCDGNVLLWDGTIRGFEGRAVGANARLKVPVEYVHALAVLPDGRRLAAGVWADSGGVGAIVVWDTGVTPPAQSVTLDFDSGVRALAVLHDDLLAAGCYDGGVRLVEVGLDDGVVVATLKGHSHDASALAVLPDGTLASAGDRTVRLWYVGAQACVAVLAGHTSGIYSLAVLADGRLASSSLDKTVRLWDVATRTCVGVLEGHTDRVWALAALPDGRLASESGDSTIRVWDTRRAVASSPRAGAGAGGGAARATPVVVLDGVKDFLGLLHSLPGGYLATDCRRQIRISRLPPP